MIIKSPVCLDISHWKFVPDFNAISPRPVLIITKATEDISFVDSKFAEYYPAIWRAGYARGAYHFFRKAYDPLKQAQHFVSVMLQYAMPEDLLILDFEEGGETAGQIITFLEYVNSVFPLNIIMSYSRKNLYDAIPMTQTQRDILKGYPVWVAGYPDNPDLYSSVPSFYVPDQTKWGVPWLWQYSAHGAVDGISGSVDCNWMHPTLYQIISGFEPGNGEPMPVTWYEIRTAIKNIRRGPGINYEDDGDLLQGDKIEVTDKLGDWYKFTRAYRGTKQLLLLHAESAYCSSGYVVVTTSPIVEPPPPPTDTFPPEIGLTIGAVTKQYILKP